jgi:hypothetical protein
VRAFAEATAVSHPGRGTAVAGSVPGALTPLHCV